MEGGETADTARHLRWLMQKDLNHQDMFLIGRGFPSCQPPARGPCSAARTPRGGAAMSTACPRRPPGAEKRRLAMLYCELRQREVEYVCLSRDTTESDLKQRREIVAGGTVLYTDQPPVRAALNGCVLVLDGLERCERNVLPTLNNLLENRELSLDDGRRLYSHSE